MDTSYNICIYTWHVPLAKNPLPILVSTYLAPSSCDRNRPPRSQVACKLLPLVPHCSLAPSPPNSQPSSGFPEPNVHLIRRITNPFPSIQNSTYCTHLAGFFKDDTLPWVLYSIHIQRATVSRDFHRRSSYSMVDFNFICVLCVWVYCLIPTTAHFSHKQ
jgi:hypothetical protein